ncbi:MAG: hypothetical protein SOR83_07085 [Butyricicoccus pullicaecorum]|nr:hypothetical protein [Butyricicoccus pullicaecorum]
MVHKKESASAESEQKRILRLEQQMKLLSVSCLACAVVGVVLTWRMQAITEQISQILVNFDLVLNCIDHGYQSIGEWNNLLGGVIQILERLVLALG